MNRESSRSHAVFTVCIKTLKKNGEITNAKESKLNMIDLAGSERQRDTKVGVALSPSHKCAYASNVELMGSRRCSTSQLSFTH